MMYMNGPIRYDVGWQSYIKIIINSSHNSLFFYSNYEKNIFIIVRDKKSYRK